MGLIGDAGQKRVFAVLFDETSAEATNRLKSAYSGHYELSDKNFLVRTSELAETVARTVGIKGDDRVVSGVVFRLNSIYAGYSSRVLWDWLGGGAE